MESKQCSLKEVESRMEAYQMIGEVSGRRDQEGLIRQTYNVAVK